MTILVLIEMVFVITREMFHGRISLKFSASAASEFCKCLDIYLSLIVNIRSGLTHLSSFQLLVLLS